MTNFRGYSGLGSMLALVGVGLLSVGCSGSEGDKNKESDAGGVIAELRSNAPRVTPNVSEATRAGQAEQEFAVSFLHALDSDSNVAFSPHSLSTAFAMLTDAAEGQTLDEVEQVLSFGTADEGFHRSQDALQLSLSARNRDALQDEQKKVDAQILSASNDIWIRDDVPPQPSYLDTLAQYYGVGVHHADFPNKPEEARVAINGKVSDDTHALIPELIPKNVITSDTMAVLTNAMYFKAPWATPLAPVAGDFHKLDGSTARAEMLRAYNDLRYYAGTDFVSVGLPYYGGELEMMLIVPDAGAYDTVRAELSSEMLTQMVSQGTNEIVDLTLPKFDVQSVVPAAQTLKALGMKTPFDERTAQFPKLASAKYDHIFIGDVLHQATVAIDEKGTEASATTAIVFLAGATAIVEPPKPKVVVADHPFLFVIRDNPTGSVLFVGQVVAP